MQHLCMHLGSAGWQGSTQPTIAGGGELHKTRQRHLHAHQLAGHPVRHCPVASLQAACYVVPGQAGKQVHQTSGTAVGAAPTNPEALSCDTHISGIAACWPYLGRRLKALKHTTTCCSVQHLTGSIPGCRHCVTNVCSVRSCCALQDGILRVAPRADQAKVFGSQGDPNKWIYQWGIALLSALLFSKLAPFAAGSATAPLWWPWLQALRRNQGIRSRYR